MLDHLQNLLTMRRRPSLEQGTLVLAFSGWMDGGDVSTGTVRRLVYLLRAEPFAEIDPEPFYICNFPGTMELTALFRPPVAIEDGLIKSLDMPSSVFYVHEPAGLVMFLGKEPNLQWRSFGQCIVELAHQVGIRRILFIGSFGGTVPHTREPRLFVSASAEELLPAVQKYGLRRTTYAGPGSFTTYLMTQAKSAGLDMVSLVAEIPGYLQGTNPLSIEAVTRRLAKILKLPLDLASLRSASTEWELEVSSAIEQNPELAQKVRELEDQYDNDLLQREAEEA
jgi:proteasome assembly chaperone (PAC2) family protein